MTMADEPIAKELDVSVGTVSSGLHHSHRLLREFLKSNDQPKTPTRPDACAIATISG